ncbi:mobile element protein [Vibrio variabilis]|uniref:Mobile element protein n=1 Tax=Vibrio variabilis TaxID=990271 RepID=A0ABQ0J7M9_9VIBR|nr:mobile element protein [Vibrio variabilis]
MAQTSPSVDTSTHKIVAAELSLSDVTDGEVLPNLLQQPRRTIKANIR